MELIEYRRPHIHDMNLLEPFVDWNIEAARREHAFGDIHDVSKFIDEYFQSFSHHMLASELTQLSSYLYHSTKQPLSFIITLNQYFSHP